MDPSRRISSVVISWAQTTPGGIFWGDFFTDFVMRFGFALAYMLIVFVIGIAVGCAMGYFGGSIDLFGQRVIEIWQNIPFLYIVIIVASIVRPTIGYPLGNLCRFWMDFDDLLHANRNAKREVPGLRGHQRRFSERGNWRVIFRHVLPNTISILVTFMPFTVASAIASLTALDFLGFGLPVPTPSWGELLQRGVQNLNAPWIVTSAFGGLVVVLLLVTFIGEAIREAFDPKKFTVYR